MKKITIGKAIQKKMYGKILVFPLLLAVLGTGLPWKLFMFSLSVLLWTSYYVFYLNAYSYLWTVDKERIDYQDTPRFNDRLRSFLTNGTGTRFNQLLLSEITSVTFKYKKNQPNTNDVIALGLYAPTLVMPYLRDKVYLQVKTAAGDMIQLNLADNYFHDEDQVFFQLTDDLTDLFQQNQITVYQNQEFTAKKCEFEAGFVEKESFV